ncbi:hypothetical protein JST97_36470 [bacterium]|nr:hypothetical protein [bacterium]
MGRLLQFWRRWALFSIFWTLLVGASIGAAVFAWPRYYASHFSVFVTGPFGAGASAQVQMQVAALFGLSSGGTEYVLAVLNSDEVQLKVIEKLRLREDKDFWWGVLLNDFTKEKALEQLHSLLHISGPQAPLQGPVTLSVRTISPQLSYDITRELLALLNERLERETKGRSVFLEEQLNNSKLELDRAEKALKEFAEKENITVALEEESKEELTAQVGLRTQKILSEVEIKALRGRLNAPGDVKVQMVLQSELAGLEAKLAQLDEVLATREAVFKKLPRKTKRYMDLVRDVKSREKIFEVYLEHYELARLYDVGKSETRPYRIVDVPYLATRPVKRYGLYKTLAGLAAGLLLALAWAVSREALAMAQQEAARLEPLPSQRSKPKKPAGEPQL